MPPSVDLATIPQALGTCTKAGTIRRVSGVEWKCVKVGNSLHWKKSKSNGSQAEGQPLDSGSVTRSLIDRPGAGIWDIKFLYVTFKDGPDSQRDVNGQIAGMASEVNRYFSSQNPGNRLRFDTYKGALDIQHLPLPISNSEFRELFLRSKPGNTQGPPLEIYIQQWLADAGLQWKPVLSGQRTTNERAFVWIVEGSRGPEWWNGGWQKMVCNQWDNEWSGIVMRFLRDLDGKVCPPLTSNWLPTEAQWNAAWSEKSQSIVGSWPPSDMASPYKWWGKTVIRGLIVVLILQPSCDHVNQASIAQMREALGENDFFNPASIDDRPIGNRFLATLDPIHRYYFKITSGPWVGDKCRDMQFSPYWEKI